jgi:dTDP-4-amino-4,6-dideoxygalactose transaminase
MLRTVTSINRIEVPFFRPMLAEAEIAEVMDTLQSGWLTTGGKVRSFERAFAVAVSAKHAVAVNSCTAALHLAVEALELRPMQAVLVPTMTFAATAEVVRYQGAIPILVDCDPATGNMNLQDAQHKIEMLREGKLWRNQTDEPRNHDLKLAGIMPVHVGGYMMNVAEVKQFAADHNLWIVEDAAHSFPAAWRSSPDDDWQSCGEETADVSCFSFYANKTITTGEGGMAVTNRLDLSERMRLMSLHGLSHDAWNRYATGGKWDYKIIAPGFKYNLTDIAASIGLHQLARAEFMRLERECLVTFYSEALSHLDELELPPQDQNRIHSWHLFPIKLRLERLAIDRNEFINELKAAGVGCSVHWRPLHLHPYYQQTFGWQAEDFPVASNLWERLISLPLFPGMRADETEHVVGTITDLCRRYRR